MSEPESDSQSDRRARTRWLMIGAVVSLVLPLLAAVLFNLKGGGAGNGPGQRGDVFEHREGADRRVTPTLVPPPAFGKSKKIEAAGESSLDYIKPSTELSSKVEGAQAAPAPAAAPTPATAKKAATTLAAPSVASKRKKIFAAPKLQPSRGFTNLGVRKNAADQNAAPTSQQPQDLLKNLPPEAANNPQLQQYLKQQGQ